MKRSNTLKQITAKAKRLRKANPKMKWQNAIRQASKELRKTTPLHQRGKSTKRDALLKALPPGKRKSDEGNTYFEYRKNRSDLPGSLTGIGEAKLMGELKKRIENKMGKAYIDFNKAKTAREKKEQKGIIKWCKTKLNKFK